MTHRKWWDENKHLSLIEQNHLLRLKVERLISENARLKASLIALQAPRTCAECGHQFDVDELIGIGHLFYCWSCRDRLAHGEAE